MNLNLYEVTCALWIASFYILCDSIENVPQTLNSCSELNGYGEILEIRKVANSVYAYSNDNDLYSDGTGSVRKL